MKVPDAPQGEKMACGENPKTYDSEKNRGPTSAAGEITFIREAFAKAETYKAKWDRYLAGQSPDAPEDDPRLDTLAAILEGRIAVHMHCYRAQEMAVMLDLARDIGFRIAAFHHAVEGYKIAPLLVSRGICSVVWSDWWGFKVEGLDGIRENAAFFDAAGGCVTMHSDSPFLGQWLNVEAGKAAAAGRRAGLSLAPEHVISWITSNPAKAMGLSDRIGTLAPGLDADLVLWSGDPFSVYTHADLVFIDGAAPGSGQTRSARAPELASGPGGFASGGRRRNTAGGPGGSGLGYPPGDRPGPRRKGQGCDPRRGRGLEPGGRTDGGQNSRGPRSPGRYAPDLRPDRRAL